MIDCAKISDEDLRILWYNTTLKTEIGMMVEKEYKMREKEKKDIEEKEAEEMKAETVLKILNKYKT